MCDCKKLEYQLRVAEQVIREEGGTPMFVFYKYKSAIPDDRSWVTPLLIVISLVVAGLFFYKPSVESKPKPTIEKIEGTNIEI